MTLQEMYYSSAHQTGIIEKNLAIVKNSVQERKQDAKHLRTGTNVCVPNSPS